MVGAIINWVKYLVRKLHSLMTGSRQHCKQGYYYPPILQKWRLNLWLFHIPLHSYSFFKHLFYILLYRLPVDWYMPGTPTPPPIVCKRHKQQAQTAPSVACYGSTSWSTWIHIDNTTYAGQYGTYYWGPWKYAHVITRPRSNGRDHTYTGPPPHCMMRSQRYYLRNYRISDGQGHTIT